MVKPASFDSNGMKKGAWSEEEDNKLRAYIMRYGHWNWRLLPKYAGLKRCGKSCRLRWVNYLKPGVKKGNFTKEEEELIVKLQRELGNKWSAIAARFPGRTDSEIKNYWYRRIEKRCNKRKHEAKANANSNNQETCNSLPEEENPSEITFSNSTSQMESFTSSINAAEILQDSAQSVENNIFSEEPQLNFWTNSLSLSQNEYFPPLPEKEYFNQQNHYDELSTVDSSFISSVLDWIEADDQAMITDSNPVTEPVQGNLWSESFGSDSLTNYSQSEENCFYPLFQHSDQGAYTGCDRYGENMENLWSYNECTLI